jgi:pimeloyl-ACP methyl ester carboxylesterase
MRRLRIVVVGSVWACTACGEAADVDTALVSQALEGGSPEASVSVSGDSLEETSLAEVAAEKLQTATLATGIDMVFVEQGSAQGIPVILVHGYTDSHHSFDLNLPRFPARFHVFAIDQRGHGDSSKPACCYTQADFANDIPAFMDAVGIERASLVGHSMGSFIVQKVALDFPERVAGLVLIGSAPTIAGNPVALELKAAVDTLTDPIDPEFVLGFQSSTFFRPVPAEYLETAVAESLKVPASIWQQALDGLLAEDHSATARCEGRARRGARALRRHTQKYMPPVAADGGRTRVRRGRARTRPAGSRPSAADRERKPQRRGARAPARHRERRARGNRVRRACARAMLAKRPNLRRPGSIRLGQLRREPPLVAGASPALRRPPAANVCPPLSPRRGACRSRPDRLLAERRRAPSRGRAPCPPTLWC